MPEIEYRPANFRAATLAIIDQANRICAELGAQGFTPTLRQLYYQFVSRDLIPNKQTEYKRLGSIINDARLAGLLDWDYIVDRTRGVRDLPHWGDAFDEDGTVSARTFVRSVLPQFRISKWVTQPVRVEVWIEKDALVGVIERVCQQLDVPYFACRGNPSQSEVWEAAHNRFAEYLEPAGPDGHQIEKVIVLYLGDHDPNGIDITRDITSRFEMFMEGDGYDSDNVEVRRIALNLDQVRQYNPPPNPAKETDSRFQSYVREFGVYDSWELDALQPSVIVDLIRDEVELERDDEAWDEAVEKQQEGTDLLTIATRRWAEVVNFLKPEATE
jgi:hypothetical protein